MFLKTTGVSGFIQYMKIILTQGSN